ncbi:heme-binding protein [Mycobacterium sp. pUA109]|uniref:heme-binding protein n=1 Tax=Mycobacterium sp. pUA109 TaxID=3238982 RepID=UPI00351B6E6B
MKISARWPLAISLAAVGVLGGVVVSRPAGAAPDPCTAAGLASTASGVLSDAGGYLGNHPEANTVLTNAVGQAPDEARNSVRGYFAGHLNELSDLQNIAKPLSNLRNQCGVSVSPGQLATLFDTLSA